MYLPAITTETSSRSCQDLDELLLGSADLVAMPFEFSCDFASVFDANHLDVEASGLGHRLLHAQAIASTSRPTETKRSHKRKSDSLMPSSTIAPRSLSVLTGLSSEHDVLSSCADAPPAGSTQIGRWTKKEHELFLEGLRLYGKSWKKISSLVVTRTLVQIRTHAQKYLQKQTKLAMKTAAAAAAAAAGGAPSTALSKSRKAVPQLLDTSRDVWKPHHYDQESSDFLPIDFPDQVAASSSAFSVHKEFGVPSISAMSKLDQLLHDDAHTSGGSGGSHDDYYSSPTSSDDDLVQWLQHRHLPYLTSSSSPATKRRRTESSSDSTNAWAIVNPMEVMTAHSGDSSASFYSSHVSAASSDLLPPLSSAYATAAAASHSHSDSDFTFDNAWM